MLPSPKLPASAAPAPTRKAPIPSLALGAGFILVNLLGLPALALLPGVHAPGAAPGWGALPGALTAQVAERFEPPPGYTLPPQVIQEFFERDTNFATLDQPGPDGQTFLVPRATELSSLARLGEPTARLAELELRLSVSRPWHLDTWGIHGFRFFHLEARRFVDVELPEGTFASDFMWSPDGSRVAFLAHPHGAPTRVQVADARSGEVTTVADAAVNATVGTRSQGQGSRPSDMLQWTPEGSVLTLVVPEARGPEPVRPAVPSSPGIRRTPERAVQTRTFPNLLQDAWEEDLLEYHTTSQIAELTPDGGVRPVGEAAMWTSISLAPDGRHLVATRVERPFSFLVAWGSFPRTTVILDRATGQEVAVLSELPLREGGGFGGAGGSEGRRDVQWRPDGAGLAWIARNENGGGDRLVLAPDPADLENTVTMATSEYTLQRVFYTADGGHALAPASQQGRAGVVHFDLSGGHGGDPDEGGAGTPPAEGRLLLPFAAQDDPLNLRGDLVTQRTPQGGEVAVVTSDGAATWITGPGFAEDFRPQPFVDRVALADGRLERVFEGSKDYWERPLVPLDPDFRRFVVQREGQQLFPDSWLATPEGLLENLTRNEDPFPELTAARRIDFSFTRRDGLEVQARVSLPTSFREGERVPAVFWTYPREYTTPEGYQRAALRARNHNRFHQVTWLRWSDLWLSQGYAVVDPDIPIVGENFNDTYIANLVDATHAAIRAVDALGVVDVDRLGHGGHSYGAFTTLNLVAHAPFFRAGIAGHGAYNRTLTPNGFQSERRTLWEAPHTYAAISPFFHAHQIQTPLLLYHGADDNNTGTWPMQSERLIQALTGLGKDAVLYLYPFESHTPRALENNLDMWARWLEWFDHYVKNEGQAPASVAEEEAGGG
jgi:dipeptidyl aminopeptidase/acylaminoacyl peptidase